MFFNNYNLNKMVSQICELLDSFKFWLFGLFLLIWLVKLGWWFMELDGPFDKGSW